MVGRSYLERGASVRVVVCFNGVAPGRPYPPVVYLGPDRPGPKNVLIERCGGELVVRPFRGLRRERLAGTVAG